MEKIGNDSLILPDRSDSTLIQLSDNATFRWLHDGQAYEVAIRSARREDIDASMNANFSILDQWDTTQPLYSVQDLSDPNINITPYFRSRLGELETIIKTSNIKGASIIILNNGFAGQLVKHLLRFFINRADGTIEQIWFTDAQKAYEELEKRIASNG